MPAFSLDPPSSPDGAWLAQVVKMWNEDAILRAAARRGLIKPEKPQRPSHQALEALLLTTFAKDPRTSGPLVERLPGLLWQRLMYQVEDAEVATLLLWHAPASREVIEFVLEVIAAGPAPEELVPALTMLDRVATPLGARLAGQLRPLLRSRLSPTAQALAQRCYVKLDPQALPQLLASPHANRQAVLQGVSAHCSAGALLPVLEDGDDEERDLAVSALQRVLLSDDDLAALRTLFPRVPAARRADVVALLEGALTVSNDEERGVLIKAMCEWARGSTDLGRFARAWLGGTGRSIPITHWNLELLEAALRDAKPRSALASVLKALLAPLRVERLTAIARVNIERSRRRDTGTTSEGAGRG
ncbi:MAG: hypothetical protein MUC96_16945 [Myxococcaceae bacterium]|nr:hypothetical protein [Myxococcaceae bacterium]